MKSTIEPAEGNTVKLSVVVEEAELDPAIDNAWKKIAREVRIPGFRQGKVPRKVLEKRIEKSYARGEALQEAVADFYMQAVREHTVDVIDQPSFDITAGEEEGDLHFDATVLVRPEVSVEGYHGMEIQIPNPIPDDQAVSDQLERLRSGYATFKTVDRPAQTGDQLTIDIEGSQHGEAIDGLVAEDYSYRLGSDSIVPQLDESLTGAKAGDTVEFDADHPDPDEEEQVHFVVVLKDVQEQVLPELTDEWVAEQTEFDTVEAFRDDVVERLTRSHREQASNAVQTELAKQLAAMVDEPLPEPLVSGEMRARIENMSRRLAAQGIGLETWLQVTGQDPASFTAELREASEEACKVDLALRAIVKAENFQPDAAEIDAEIERLATEVGLDSDQVRTNLDAGDQLPALAADLGNRKALEWLTSIASIVDQNGHPVSRDQFDLDLDDDDLALDHDHDHDHDHHDHDHDHDH